MHGRHPEQQGPASLPGTRWRNSETFTTFRLGRGGSRLVWLGVWAFCRRRGAFGYGICGKLWRQVVQHAIIDRMQRPRHPPLSQGHKPLIYLTLPTI